MHLEIIVPGPPASNQSRGPNLERWRVVVETEARVRWLDPPLNGKLKGIIINFHLDGEPTLDVDNMAKPIFDSLEEIVYHDDRQIHQAELAHVRIDGTFRFVGVSTRLINAIQSGLEFVYIRIEDALNPFPLPRQVDEHPRKP